jgi:hypothetical protein
MLSESDMNTGSKEFAVRRNIELYGRLQAEATDPSDRLILAKLLGSELVRLQEFLQRNGASR